jgi:hypothetical protein
MVLQISSILLRIAETVNNARSHNSVLYGLFCLGLDVPCEEYIGSDD